MSVTFQDIQNSVEIRTYITQADASLIALGFTEHSFAHVGRCADVAARILNELGYPAREVELARIAALILADKTEVRRSRVRNNDGINFDIHDRVNYAVERSEVLLDTVSGTVTLSLTINTQVCAVMDYFEIFLQRMVLCRKAAEFFHLQFHLEINGQILL